MQKKGTAHDTRVRLSVEVFRLLVYGGQERGARHVASFIHGERLTPNTVQLFTKCLSADILVLSTAKNITKKK